MQLAVHVTPKAGRDEVIGWRLDANGERELQVKVSAPPEKGKATKAVCSLLAKYFGVAKSKIVCVRGETSRHKMIEVPDSIQLP